MPALADSVAVQRYLQRHIEPDLPVLTAQDAHWRHVLVIPAYREPASLLQHLSGVPTGAGRVLVVLVLNRPDTEPDAQANAALREAAHHLPRAPQVSAKRASVYCLADHADLCVHDLESLRGPTPGAQGVGAARKSGCDLAFSLLCKGMVADSWIHCSDADASLPLDYFKRLAHVQAPAATFPFCHVPGEDALCNQATDLYELRLHHYVLGLRHARSPYAFHALGSCLAVSAEAYAQVRGFPRRAGAEDFYLLNKLAKIAPPATLAGKCVALASRRSDRAPFGTGPAVRAMLAQGPPDEQPIFYAPQVFSALRAVLTAVSDTGDSALAGEPAHLSAHLTARLSGQGLDERTAHASLTALQTLGLDAALAHSRAHSRDPAQFARHFHQWFDGFRTLKFIHALSEGPWPRLSLAQLQAQPLTLLPKPRGQTPCAQADVPQLLRAIRARWRWRT